MSRFLSRRIFLTGLGAVAGPGLAWAGAPQTSLRPHPRMVGLLRRSPTGPEALIAGSGVSGDVAFAVADVKTGLVLEGARAADGLPPASVAKALTSLYALDVLGPEFSFQTRLLATGPVTKGVLQGDLVLAGGGDPTLDTVALAEMAKQLKAAGVREVRGDFIVYHGALPYVRSIDPEQPDHVGYSTSVSGIALNFNVVHFEWKRGSKGYAVTLDARAKGYRPDVEIARMRVIKRKLPVYTYKDGGGVDEWTVASQALGSGGARWLPVRQPALYAGDVFRTLARTQGIVLKQARPALTLPGDARVLAQHNSAPLGKILRDMLKYSNNMTAEMVGMTASAARGRKPVSLRDSADQMNKWAAETYGMEGARLVDHSGLGDASRIPPQDLVRALVQVGQRGILRPLLKPFPMRDAKGRIDKAHPITVSAKTGTLNFVSGLGGYIKAADGTELAFAIFTADPDQRAKIDREERERPPGARAWNRRSRKLQQKLIERWGQIYGS